MTVSLTINGTEIKAEAGMTVLQAAQANNIYIPTLCYAPKLRPVGACRMCVVEVEKMRGYPTACTVPVTEGMVVHTETEALQNLRRETLYLILSEHPYTCLVCKADCGLFHGGTIRKAAVTTGCQYCPASGQCELQNLVDYLQIRDIPYPITYRHLPVEHEDPFFDRDYNLCILCGRCVRVCQEVRHAGVLTFINRGSQAIVGTAFGRSHLDTNCQFCGACVDVCPTGALADKRSKWEGLPSVTVSSICPYCSVGCTVQMQAKNGRLIRAVGHNDGQPNDGQLCMRGRFGMVDVVHDLARLKEPLVRRNGRMVPVSWDEALGLVAEQLGQYRADQFALITSAGATNEDNYALQKFARTIMGSNNIALATGVPEHEGESELINTFKMIDGPVIRKIRQAAAIMVIGANVFDSHPILGLEIRHALSKGASLITVDARQTKMAKQSTVWLQPKIGTDQALLAGLVSLLDPSGSGQVDLAEVAAITGIQPEQIAATASQLAERRPLIIIYGSGVTHHPTALKVIQAIRLLAVTVEQAGIISLPGEGNLVGSYDLGTHPALLPGYRPVADPAARTIFETAWGVELNPRPGRGYAAILDGIRQGQIKALYLAGGELPELPELTEVKFLVAQGIVTTEAMEYASVILPTTTFAEIDGTMTNLEGRVQCLHPAIKPIGMAQPGWMIAGSLARLMGNTNWTYQSAAEVMAEIANLVPAYAGVNYDSLGVIGRLRRFEPAAEMPAPPLTWDGAPQFTSAQFPLTLITERNLFYYKGVSLTEHVKGMNRLKHEEILHLNPVDAARIGVEDGALVKVTSPYGSMECILQANNGLLAEGDAFISLNRTNSYPIFPTLTPNVKACAIRVEKI